MTQKKIYSGIDRIPSGKASEKLTPGCLVLEGGAFKGLYTQGVLDAFMLSDLNLQCVIGVSAGALSGANYVSGQIGRSIRYNMRFCDDPRYCSLESLRKTGDLYGVQFCYDEIPNKLDPFDKEAYRSNPMPFYAVCTNVETGKAIHKRLDNGDAKDMEYFRASASMPLVSKPVPIGTRLFLDGGISDPIPMAFLQSRGYERIVVVLTQPRDYVKKPVPLSGALRRVLRDFPALCDAMCARHLVYESERRSVFEREHAGEIFVIAPPGKLEVSRVEHDRKKLQRAYDQGREAILSRLDALHDFLAQ